MNKSFFFKILKKDSKSRARAGEIKTSHGVIETPNFVPCGTKATVRSLSPQDLKEIGVQIIFGNTYHLHLRPGEDVVKEFSGLGKFMNWGGPTITDSGGFQVFSLAKKGESLRSPRQFENSSNASVPASCLRSTRDTPRFAGSSEEFSHAKAPRDSNKNIGENQFINPCESPKLVKITDDGVTFRSHVDGSLHEFTPEKSIEIQQKLGADIILAFDECVPYPYTHESTKKAMERTHEWAIRCLKVNPPSEESRSLPRHLGGGRLSLRSHDSSEVNSRQALYGIVQGGVYKDLREESAKFISSLSFDGIAIGGVAVGESKKEMREVIDWVVPFLPEEKPKHLLGIGEIDDLFDGVERGMDTFDCVIPTRFGRYGIAFVGKDESEEKEKYRINLQKSIYAKDKRPIAKNCKCSTCQNFTRGYINHLLRCNELLGYRFVSYHNLAFIINLMKEIRLSILEERFREMKKEWVG